MKEHNLTNKKLRLASNAEKRKKIIHLLLAFLILILCGLLRVRKIRQFLKKYAFLSFKKLASTAQMAIAGI